MSSVKVRRSVMGVVWAAAVTLLCGASLEERVRKGNAAFARGDYQAAVEFYEQAEGRIADPGLVAFNKGAALYQLGEFGQAAEQYVRALEDAAGVRRVNALYGLANAQVQHGRLASGKPALELLSHAVRNYQDCLRMEKELPPDVRAACDQTFDYARANIEIAELLLAKKKAEREQDSANTAHDSRTRPDERDDPSPDRDVGSGGRNPSRPVRNARKPDPAEVGVAVVDQHSPGAGHLPTMLEGGPSLEPGRALGQLQEAMMRLRGDRARSLRAVIEGTGVRDW